MALAFHQHLSTFQSVLHMPIFDLDNNCGNCRKCGFRGAVGLNFGTILGVVDILSQTKVSFFEILIQNLPSRAARENVLVDA